MKQQLVSLAFAISATAALGGTTPPALPSR
jgi:hypothetical protein